MPHFFRKTHAQLFRQVSDKSLACLLIHCDLYWRRQSSVGVRSVYIALLISITTRSWLLLRRGLPNNQQQQQSFQTTVRALYMHKSLNKFLSAACFGLFLVGSPGAWYYHSVFAKFLSSKRIWWFLETDVQNTEKYWEKSKENHNFSCALSNLGLLC